MSASKASRPSPFTPKRGKANNAEFISSFIPADSPAGTRLPSSTRSITPQPASPKKIKATLSAEIPKRKVISGRSTPSSPRKKDKSPGSSPNSVCSSPTKEMLDPEDALVDWKNVEADLSGEIDTKDLVDFSSAAEDKVLVSIRIKPTSLESAWIHNPMSNTISLSPSHSRHTSSKPPTHTFDRILTGSDNKSVYSLTAKAHVRAAMEGYNAVVFAYGQTASGKTFTLSGDDSCPGITPLSMRDVFSHIRATPSREYLLRASYLEIYNEAIHDLLAPPSMASASEVSLTESGVVGLREEVVTSLKGIREVLARGEANRRTASTDWNERSSRSHSVFRLVIESREVAADHEIEAQQFPVRPVTPGGTLLQTRGGRSVQSSVLSLIDLAGSEKATSDKDRTREGRYINTSLLTLGTVIGTLAENAAKKKNDHVPYRNSKLTRLLQPCLAGNARISVICTINAAASAVGETTSTLGFASRVKKVHLHATKKEVVDTDALLERYRKEIEELKRRLEEREREAPVRNRRLSAKQQEDESKAVNDISGRIRQLTKLILTSSTVDESKAAESRPASPSKLDFDLSPYELQKQLLVAKDEIEQQATVILSLEATLAQRAVIPLDSPEHKKDLKITHLQKTVKELELVIRRYEENLGEPLRAVREDVEKTWEDRVELLDKEKRDADAYIRECEMALEKERQMRLKLEEEKRALITFVQDIDVHISQRQSTASVAPSFPSSQPFRPTLAPLAEADGNAQPPSAKPRRSPDRKHFVPSQIHSKREPSLLINVKLEEGVLDSVGNISFSEELDKENAPVS